MRLTKDLEAPPIIVDADSYFDTYLSFNPFDEPKEVAKNVFINIRQDVMNSFNEDFMTTVTPLKTFRNEIFPEYKIKRKPRSETKSEALKAFIDIYYNKVVYHENFEADDIACYFMNKGSKVLAIDKDIKGVRTQHVFDYKQKRIYQPITKYEAEQFMVYQSLMGDSADGIPGAAGIGASKAKKLIENQVDVFEFVQQFGSIEAAELSMQLIRMDQIDENIKLKLWKIEDWKLQ